MTENWNAPPPPPHAGQPGSHQATPVRPWWKSLWFLVAAAAVVGIGIGAGSASGSGKTAAAKTQTATVSTTATATVEATVTEQPTTVKTIATRTRTNTVTYTPPPPKAFTDGTYAVGEDIKPGTYHSSGGDGYCAWIRARDAAGSDIIDLGNTSNGPLTVTVEPSDGALKIQGDCTFRRRS